MTPVSPPLINIGKKEDLVKEERRVSCSLKDGRGFYVDECVMNLAKILVQIKETGIRETVAQIKVMNSLGSNIKILGQGEVKILANTLEHLGGSMDWLNKSGIVLNILIKVYKLLPYRCEGCV